MREAWDTLNQELATHGFRLVDNQSCQYLSSNKIKNTDLNKAYKIIGKELKDNKQLMSKIWNELSESLTQQKNGSKFIDPVISRLFTFSLKDLAVWLKMFDPEEVDYFTRVVDYALQRDILEYSSQQINNIIDYKINIDWLHRVICRLIYTRRLIRFAHEGRHKVNKCKIVEARGVGGPWSKLDLPMRERVFGWWEEDENFRNRDRDIRKQRRYRKGLENYNNGGSVGEGHYWREIRNEPYSWSSRQSESPYPHRSTLFWG